MSLPVSIYLDEPARLNLTAKRGTDARLTLTFLESVGGDAMDLTGYTLTASIRKYPKDATPTAAFAVNDDDAATGIIILDLTDTQTDSLSLCPTPATWSLLWTDPTGKIECKAHGSITFED